MKVWQPSLPYPSMHGILRFIFNFGQSRGYIVESHSSLVCIFLTINDVKQFLYIYWHWNKFIHKTSIHFYPSFSKIFILLKIILIYIYIYLNMNIQFAQHHLLKVCYSYFIVVALYVFSKAALTKHHNCVSYHNRNLKFLSSGGYQSKIKLSAGPGSLSNLL